MLSRLYASNRLIKNLGYLLYELTVVTMIESIIDYLEGFKTLNILDYIKIEKKGFESTIILYHIIYRYSLC